MEARGSNAERYLESRTGRQSVMLVHMAGRRWCGAQTGRPVVFARASCYQLRASGSVAAGGSVCSCCVCAEMLRFTGEPPAGPGRL